MHTHDACISLQGRYVKQSLMNRCWIKTASGIQALVIPMVHTGNPREFKEAGISYQENWPQRFSRTLMAAYKKSAYYDYYFPEFSELFNSRPDTLSELNLSCTSILWKVMGKNNYPEINNSEKFTFSEIDYPPRPHTETIPACESDRFQLFGDFIPGLSALDVLFHYGPSASEYLSDL